MWHCADRLHKSRLQIETVQDATNKYKFTLNNDKYFTDIFHRQPTGVLGEH